MPHQKLPRGKWYCSHCNIYSNQDYQTVLNHELVDHVAKWNKFITGFKEE